MVPRDGIKERKIAIISRALHGGQSSTPMIFFKPGDENLLASLAGGHDAFGSLMASDPNTSKPCPNAGTRFPRPFCSFLSRPHGTIS